MVIVNLEGLISISNVGTIKFEDECLIPNSNDPCRVWPLRAIEEELN